MGKKCTPGVDGTCLARVVTASATKSDVTLSSTNLFCFAVYMNDTGSTKKIYDLELLRTNLFLGSSIFGCEAYKVYSDVSTWLSPGDVDTEMVTELAGAPFHFAKRKETGTWINSNIFLAVWKKIEEQGLWEDKDWTVKVDADAVFLPSRLRQKLLTQEVTSNGIYLENCKFVNFGFFGNLEVISRKAVATSRGARTCSRSGAWTFTALTRSARLTSPLTGCARPSGRKARRRTRSGHPTAQPRRRPRCTRSRTPRSTSTA